MATNHITQPLTKLWMRHQSFERALRGAVAMTSKYPDRRFAVRGDHLAAGYGWALVEVAS